MKRKLFLQIGLITCVLSVLVGCVSRALENMEYYTEEVSSVLITEDQKKLIILTDQYHYIVNAPEIIVKTLNSDLRRYVQAHFGYISVNQEGEVSGSLYLRPNETFDNVIRETLSLGYKQTDRGPTAHVQLTGQRYTASKITVGKQYLLNDTYKVKVHEPGDVKEVLSPISNAIDGTLQLAVIPLAALGMGFAIILQNLQQ